MRSNTARREPVPATERSMVGDGSSWKPILTGDLGRQASEAIEAVSEHIAGVAPGAIEDPSLSGGLAGIATFYASLAQNGAAPEAVALDCLDHAIDIVATSAIGAGLYSGFTGVAWAAEVVDRSLQVDGEDRNEAIDEALEILLKTADWTHAPFDLINGLAGLGVYALERLPVASAEECVALVVGRLDELARRDGDQTYWWTEPHLIHARRPEYPDGYVDAGVAHGVPGVIPFLSAACAASIAEATARPLLDGAVAWVLDRAVPEDPETTIPYFDAPGARGAPARSAWCYGDPGVAATLLVAARTVENASWELDAIALARRAASRPVEETGVVDAGFCHGSAGLGHLFNRMYQTTGDRQLGQTARYWLQRTLDWCPSPDDLRRSQSDADAEAALPWDGLGVLEGAAGVAMVLLAAATPIEPVWDRMFLVSLRRAADRVAS